MRALRRAHGLRLAWLLLGVAGSACARGPRSDVSDSTFVATMADLRRVQRDTAADSSSRAAARARVLQRRGLTAAQLEQKARALSASPERANKVFQAIARKTAAEMGVPTVAPRAPGVSSPTRVRPRERRRRSPTR